MNYDTTRAAWWKLGLVLSEVDSITQSTHQHLIRDMAVDAYAEALGLTPDEQFEKIEVLDMADTGPECLRPSEFSSLSTGSLSESRMAHLGVCADCRALAAACAPVERRVRDFRQALEETSLASNQ